MDYELLMKRCIELAKNAYGCVSPNPLVGCVILDNNGKIISEGYHEKYGEFHAERNALLKLLPSDNPHTLVVNLEPCCHYGKTPPCTDIIIEKGIKKAVIGMRDVNPIISGNGIKKLKEAGIEVIENVLEKECRELNEIFIKNMSEHKTFVAVKTATTIDGKIAAYNGSSKWITSELARNEVKKLRKIYDAILTSSATVIADNPTMEHNNKIVIDRNLQTDFENANIYKSGQVLVFYDKNIESVHLKSVLRTVENKTNINLLPAETNSDRIDLCSVLDEIYKRGIMSVIVEAGGRLNGSVLRHTDKIYQFMAPKVLGDNKGLSCFDFRTAEDISDAEVFKIADIQKFEPDILITYKK